MNPIILSVALTAAFFLGITAVLLSIIDDRIKKDSNKKLKNDGIKDEFMHMIVHELRAPLTSIKDSSELLLNIRSSLKEEEQEQFIKMINRQSKVLLEEISSILDSARLETGTLTLFKKKENIQDVIHEKVKIFEPQAEKKNITISSHIEGPIPEINIDAMRIGQVVNNLLSNSIKFTQSGGQISISAKVVGGNLEVSVSDTGVGIPKALQKNIFSKFYQVKTTDRQKEKDGSGLGLYIVKKIIDAHNGIVSIESDTGKGTIMIFTLPFEGKLTKENVEPATQKAQYTLPN